MPLPVFDTSKFWNFVSNFFTYFDDYSRDLVENFWHGLHLTGETLVDRANRFKEAIAPENTRTDVQDYYYEVLISPLTSIPLKLDPTDENSDHVITPISRIEIEPYYVEQTPVYGDQVEIGSADYYTIRDIGIGMYVVVQVDRDGVADKYFKIKNLLSSEETVASGRYYQHARFLTDGITPDVTSYKYIIELENADLSYIGDDNFTIYLTNGRAYRIDENITTLPNLYSKIGIWPNVSTTQGSILYEDIDYTFYNSVVEFNNDPFEFSDVVPGSTLYCPQADMIETNLYYHYGKLLGISEASRYAFTNVSGKASINALLKSMQNSSNTIDYERILNIYYGLPVAPQDCKVVGLYESFDYKVIDRSVNEITVELEDDTELHPFFQVDSVIRFSDHREQKVNTIVNRALGKIELDDASGIKINDTFNLKLKNKYSIKNIQAESPTVDGHIKIYSTVEAAHIQHIIDMVQNITDNEQYPEILVYGTSGFTVNYDGIYHITQATDDVSGVIQLDIYNPANDDEPRYNDYLETTSADMDIGFVHIPMPTHKYLLLLMDDGTYYKAYIDAPIDTIYDEGDNIEKYTQLCRCVSVINDSIFPGWNEFDGFRRFNGIDENSSIVETVSIIPNTVFGEYFPADFKVLT